MTKISDEALERFEKNFPPAMLAGGRFMFNVDVTKVKNLFTLFIADETCAYQMFFKHSLGQYSYADPVGIVGEVNTLFAESNPIVMLRPCIISLDELVEKFNIDRHKILSAVIKKLKHYINTCTKNPGDKIRFVLSKHGESLKDFTPASYSPETHDTPDVSSVDELLVWADMHVQ